MFTILSHTQTDKAARAPITWRAVGTFIGDLIAAISIFATGYLVLLIGHGLGLN